MDAITKKQHLTHGCEPELLYHEWCNIRQRCKDKTNKYYGAKGITVCKEWNNFENFRDWALANGWKNETFTRKDGKQQIVWSTDRIDNNRGYEPSNCRIASWTEQMRNQTRNHCITWNEETHCLAEWEEITGLPIKHRINNGWSIEKTFTKPRKGKRGT